MSLRGCPSSDLRWRQSDPSSMIPARILLRSSPMVETRMNLNPSSVCRGGCCSVCNRWSYLVPLARQHLAVPPAGLSLFWVSRYDYVIVYFALCRHSHSQSQSSRMSSAVTIFEFAEKQSKIRKKVALSHSQKQGSEYRNENNLLTYSTSSSE